MMQPECRIWSNRHQSIIALWCCRPIIRQAYQGRYVPITPVLRGSVFLTFYAVSAVASRGRGVVAEARETDLGERGGYELCIILKLLSCPESWIKVLLMYFTWIIFCWLKWYWICIEIVKCVMSGRHQIKRGAMQSRKYIGEKSPGSLSPLLRLVGRHVHDACSVRPRRTLPLWQDNVTRVPEERWRWAQHVRTYTFDW